jgi:hypothetical protein
MAFSGLVIILDEGWGVNTLTGVDHNSRLGESYDYHILRLPKVSHFLVSDPTLFSSLVEFDAELAEEILAKGCPHCGHESLHQSHYPRKPRGLHPDHRDVFSFRFSFCCAACRRRVTPPTLRFLGRKIYIGLIVILASCCEGRITAWFSRIASQTGIALRTLWRWRTFWTKAFPQSSLWREASGRLMPPPDRSCLPQSLLARFICCDSDGRVALLRFLSPMTTNSGVSRHEGC